MSDVRKEFEHKPFIKSSSISFDGKQWLCRIPSQISDSLDIKKGDVIEFKVEFEKEKKLTITYRSSK